MFFPFLPPNPTLTDRWGWLLYGLFDGMARDWRQRGLRHVHHGEITQRILGLWGRLRRVIARWEAGTLCPPPARGGTGGSSEGTPHPGPAPQGGREKPAWSVLPRRFGWLRALLRPQSQGPVIAFHYMLEEPEMKAIVAGAPREVGRILRPFCHLLGIETPAVLVLPKRIRKRGTSPRPSPRGGEGDGSRLSERDEAELARMTARFPDTPAARAAKRAIRRSMATGEPVDPRKMSAAALGYVLHPPRDGNCPLPEIGYGGRVFPPLPKGYVRPPG